jgi:hypothetical protein
MFLNGEIKSAYRMAYVTSLGNEAATRSHAPALPGFSARFRHSVIILLLALAFNRILAAAYFAVVRPKFLEESLDKRMLTIDHRCDCS